MKYNHHTVETRSRCCRNSTVYIAYFLYIPRCWGYNKSSITKLVLVHPSSWSQTEPAQGEIEQGKDAFSFHNSYQWGKGGVPSTKRK